MVGMNAKHKNSLDERETLNHVSVDLGGHDNDGPWGPRVGRTVTYAWIPNDPSLSTIPYNSDGEMDLWDQHLPPPHKEMVVTLENVWRILRLPIRGHLVSVVASQPLERSLWVVFGTLNLPYQGKELILMHALDLYHFYHYFYVNWLVGFSFLIRVVDSLASRWLRLLDTLWSIEMVYFKGGIACWHSYIGIYMCVTGEDWA